MHKLGIMQGRLSPIVDGKIQAFPSMTWREEFVLAQECGFDTIEWVVDFDSIEANPLFFREGREEIRQLQQEYSIQVPIICVDYFMKCPFQAKELNQRLQALGMLAELIHLCPEVGIKQIEIPLIGSSGIEQKEDEQLLVETIRHYLPLAKNKEVDLLFEVSIPPERIASFLDQLPSSLIQMNYDTGNSAYWEFDVQKEMTLYGNRIGNIHIKDCTPKDYSVPLGQGDVDFDQTFTLLKEMNYQGDFILQTARGEDHLQIAKEFAEFTHHYIQRYLSGT